MLLTPRLMKIASLVPEKSCLADIGTDHGYIPVHCVISGICPRAIAMDINKGPLENARDTVERQGLSDKIELRLSDGMDKLIPGEADAIVIAGMGGLLIKSILQRDIHKLGKGTVLILQPMLAQKELREYLYTSEAAIVNEYLAAEGDKLYNIIVAKVGNVTQYCPGDIVIGRNVSKNSSDIYPRYINREINTRRKILKGLEMASVRDELAIENMKTELKLLETEEV